MKTDKKQDSQPFMVKTHDITLDSEYVQWIHDVKLRYRRTQIKAAVKVNSEQLYFNWQLGRDLVIRKAEEKWGSGVVEQVSLDLQNEFPNVKGFSATNLWYMKKWYLFYAKDNDVNNILSELNLKINQNTIKLHQVGGEIDEEKLHQYAGEINFPSAFGYVPWRHHVEIITKCKSVLEAVFYIQKVINEGLSRNALINCIEADLYYKNGGAMTNFNKVLPSAQGKLAQEITKDTYNLSFIELPPHYDESALEEALEKNITRFLLELGTGFAFVGRQKEIIVSGKSRKIDMLFYHIKLRCYVVVELKVIPFEPEFAGKLNYYVNAVNNLLKGPFDNPTIGLLICKNKNKTDVQWAFEGIQTPIGVASYDNVRIKEIQDQLPSAEQIQRQIEIAEKEFVLNL